MKALNFFKNGKKLDKKELGLGTSIIVNEYGSINRVVFKIIEEKGKNVKIQLPDKTELEFEKRLIRAKRILIYKTRDGEYNPYDPDSWRGINLQEYGIEQLRFNLQNFSLQESRSAIHRWTLPEDMIKKLSPLFKLLMICIVIGVIGWGAFNFGGKMLNDLMASRAMDCGKLIPNQTYNSIISNMTKPIGV